MFLTPLLGAVNASVSYSYDAVGNFTSKSDFSSAAVNAYTYDVQGCASAVGAGCAEAATGGACGGGTNAVKTVALSTDGTRIYCYDADGNLISDNCEKCVP